MRRVPDAMVCFTGQVLGNCVSIPLCAAALVLALLLLPIDAYICSDDAFILFSLFIWHIIQA